MTIVILDKSINCMEVCRHGEGTMDVDIWILRGSNLCNHAASLIVRITERKYNITTKDNQTLIANSETFFQESQNCDRK